MGTNALAPACSGAWGGGKLNKNMKIPKYYHELNEAEQAEWMKKEKEKDRWYSAKYRAENPDKKKASSAKYYAKNLDRVKAKATKWHAKNRNKKDAMNFFQMTQALSEIANINTEKK
jgi:hypothetical protein